MTYVISDLHGYPLSSLQSLLDRAGFGEDDELYVLGDVIDRNGDGGVETLIWLMTQPNAHLLRGNHEDMLLRSAFVFEGRNPSLCERSDFSCWMWNGGRNTLSALLNLDPDTVNSILDYIKSAPLYRELTVNGRRYILSHAGIGSYKPGRPLDSYDDQDFIWFRPDLFTSYPGDARIICGHTPVVCFGEEYGGRALRTETWIDIDTGAAYGGDPTLLRLEDEQEFSGARDAAA